MRAMGDDESGSDSEPCSELAFSDSSSIGVIRSASPSLSPMANSDWEEEGTLALFARRYMCFIKDKSKQKVKHVRQ